jgi:hypothetical protein
MSNRLEEDRRRDVFESKRAIYFLNLIPISYTYTYAYGW